MADFVAMERDWSKKRYMSVDESVAKACLKMQGNCCSAGEVVVSKA